MPRRKTKNKKKRKNRIVNKCAPKYQRKNTKKCIREKPILKSIAKQLKLGELDDKKVLEKEINKFFTKSKKCKKDEQSCWLEQEELKPIKTRLKKFFRPKIPESWTKDKNTWLTNYDIMDVMEQYEDKYNDFIFLGPYPIDFDGKNELGSCFFEEMCDKPLDDFIRVLPASGGKIIKSIKK